MALPFSGKNLVHPSLEMSDPNPDIHTLFRNFNDLFFEGKLGSVSVQWSPRMTLCAGICRFRGKYGGCSIHLSKPLLSLRPRKDLVETLLHEMIHAFLFIADQNREREDHGPKFRDFMNRINAVAGTAISVYHSFHDEVAHFKTHWWKCSGPCQSRPPYFGIVKRSMNRAPGPNDMWWTEHTRTCEGKFIKIKEPSPKKKTVSKKKVGDENVPVDSKKITDFFNKEKSTVDGADSQTVFSGQGIKLGGAKRENTSIEESGETQGPPAKKKNFGKGRGDHPLLAMWEKQRNSQREESFTSQAASTATKDKSQNAKEKCDEVEILSQNLCNNHSTGDGNGIEEDNETLTSEFMDNLCPACGAFDITDLDLHLEVCPALVSIDIPVTAVTSPVYARLLQPLLSSVQPVQLTEEERLNGILVDDDLPQENSSASSVAQPVAGPSNSNGAANQQGSGSVSCPICGTALRDEAAVDAHLDDCLTRQSMGDIF